jgi:hypothetical protein
MYGSGVNLQQASEMIFVGLNHKFNNFIQGIHRIYRFGQTEICNIRLIYSDNEYPILKVLYKKWANHKKLQVEMIEIDECLEEDKKTIETMYIHLFKSWGFELENQNDGGGGPMFKSEESIEKYKNWRKDKKPMLGKKQSKETRKRKSDALKGRPKPEGFGEIISKALVP